MAFVLVIAIDLAAVSTGVIHLGLMATVPILQFGLFRMVRSGGGLRPYWVGFESAGWLGLLALTRWSFWEPWFTAVESAIDAIYRAIEPISPDLARIFDQILGGNDTLLGLVPEALVLGIPVFLLAHLGGWLAVAWDRRREGGRAILVRGSR